MPTLDDVYRKFGETSEAGQIVETSLGNIVLPMGLLPLVSVSEQKEEDGSTSSRFVMTDQAAANRFARSVDRKTFGQLIQGARPQTQLDPELEGVLEAALKERNRLTHHFYRQHNLRRNTDAGRAIMMADLESIHAVLIRAMKAVSLLNGFDIDASVQASMNRSGDPLEQDDNEVFHLPI